MEETHAGDRLLVRRMLTGDQTAFDEFFSASFPRLFRFALARLRQDADAAEDVVQAALCKAVAKLETYRGEAALFTWLCTFCRYEIVAHCRRAGRDPASVSLPEDEAEIAAALESIAAVTAEGPEDSLRREELARLVHVALDRLPPSYADALEWKYLDGLSVKEIAARLDVTAKSAESLLTRARQAFRDGFATLTRPRGRWPRPIRG